MRVFMFVCEKNKTVMEIDKKKEGGGERGSGRERQSKKDRDRQAGRQIDRERESREGEHPAVPLTCKKKKTAKNKQQLSSPHPLPLTQTLAF